MHYLKCSHCKHLNPIKTQYLVFCGNCNQKLKHNFPDWQTNNSKKSFEDFIKMVGTSQSEIEEQEKELRSKNQYRAGRKRMFFFIVVLTLIVLIAFFYFYSMYLKGL